LEADVAQSRTRKGVDKHRVVPGIHAVLGALPRQIRAL